MQFLRNLCLLLKSNYSCSQTKGEGEQKVNGGKAAKNNEARVRKKRADTKKGHYFIFCS